MKLTSKIVPYCPQWPRLYLVEKKRIAPIFKESVVSIHHVGSTSIAGMSAKPEIDILVVVNNPENAVSWTAKLAKFGYKRGRDLSRGHLFFKKDLQGIRTRKIHVCTQNHQAITDMLLFRDALLENEEYRKNYQQLKQGLERSNTHGMPEYLEKKSCFIKNVLKQVTEH